MSDFFSLTELGASHEVVACLFGVFAVHRAGLWVKLGELVSVEAVIVLHKAEGRCAVWHGLEHFLVYSLGFDVVVVDVMTYRKSNDSVRARADASIIVLPPMRLVRIFTNP